MKRTIHGQFLGVTGLVLASLLACGCQSNRSNIIAMTNTSIGVSGGLTPASQIPQVDVGYKRQEFAKVPTNRCDATCPSGPVEGLEETCDEEGKCQSTREKSCGCGQGGGAKDTGNVLMEIQGQSGLGAAFSGEIYQRLAVGDIAVRQPGAWFLMMKGMSRQAQTTAAEMIEKQLELEKVRLEATAFQLADVPWGVIDAVDACLGADKAKAAKAWDTLKRSYPEDTKAELERRSSNPQFQAAYEKKDPKGLVKSVLKRQSEARAKVMQSDIGC